MVEYRSDFRMLKTLRPTVSNNHKFFFSNIIHFIKIQ